MKEKESRRAVEHREEIAMLRRYLGRPNLDDLIRTEITLAADLLKMHDEEALTLERWESANAFTDHVIARVNRDTEEG